MSYLIDRAEEAQKRKLDFAREQSDRAAVASGNVDENSALYRHAKLNGWNLGGEDELHGPARANAVARDAAATDIVEQRAAGAPRSPISTFAADGEGNFSFYNEDNALRAGFDGIMANANAQKADRARRGRATLGSIVGHAMRNGGMVPRELAQSVGMELGQPGFVGGTLTKDGTFMSLGQGKDGSIQPTGLVSASDVLKAMVDSGNWRDAFQFDKKYMQMYTPEQKKAVTGFSPQWARGAATNELSAADKRFQLEALKVLQEMDKANKTPVTAEDFYRNNPKLITMLGTDYQRDENGQLVMDEMTGEPIEITLPPEEISKRAVAFFDGLRQSEANGGGTGMNEIQRAIVDGIRALTTPPEQQQTANIPQTGFYYRRETPNGPEMVATSGYVVGGKAYDRYGNVMQGVQPLDYQGNPIQGAAASTPAPAQQQSQAARQSDNGDTHTDERGTWQAVRDANGRVVGKTLIAPAQGGAASGAVSDMEKPVTTLGGGTQGATPPRTGEHEQMHKESQAEVRADDNQRRAQNGIRQRERTLRQAGVNESVARHYDSINRETMRRFNEAVPDATMADIYSGKYDREIASAARLADDTSTPSVIEQAQALRAEYKSVQRGKAVEAAQTRFDEEYSSGMDAIRKEADARGIRGNWSKQERDNYIKREEFMLKNRLRKRLVNEQRAIM